MFDSIRRMFSVAKTDYARLISEGAVILDVRSQREYGSGHIAGSVNIPVNKLSENLHKLEAKNKTIIACCASGMRSASAKSLLESKGYTKVINGGSWQSLDKKIKS